MKDKHADIGCLILAGVIIALVFSWIGGTLTQAAIFKHIEIRGVYEFEGRRIVGHIETKEFPKEQPGQ